MIFLAHLLGDADVAWACEPMVPLMQVVGGPIAMGGPLFLVVAIAVKCLSFPLLQKEIPRFRASRLMFEGNILTTFLGGVAIMPASAPSAFLIGIWIIFFICLAPGGRLSLALKVSRGWPISRWFIAFLMAALYFVSALLIASAQEFLRSQDYSAYWIWKPIGLTFGLGFGIAFSSLWEEWFIAIRSRKDGEQQSYLVPVFRANYIAFVVVLAILAAFSIPKRLKDPHFLDNAVLFRTKAALAQTELKSIDIFNSFHLLPLLLPSWLEAFQWPSKPGAPDSTWLSRDHSEY